VVLYAISVSLWLIFSE